MSSEPVPENPKSSPVTHVNIGYIESLYDQWKANPESLNESWQMFFAGFELARYPSDCLEAINARDQSRVASLIYAYRSQGHRIAQVDPLGNNQQSYPPLEITQFGLSDKDLDRVFDTGHLGGPQRAPLKDIITILRDIYCRSVGVEYIHVQDTNIRRWLQAQMEPVRNRPTFSRPQKLEILKLLIDAEMFETFVGTRYLGQKRFSLEGAESLIPAIHSIVALGPELGLEEIVIGMSHRGRLNVLANILDKSYSAIFSEFEENIIPSQPGGDGDVKYHKGFNSDHLNAQGRSVHLSLTANPSHLEAVDPVVEGRVRAKQGQRQDTQERKKVLPLLIHGDAAFSGQGLVAETLNLSQLKGYRTGGTVHIIVNNQIGFTTLPTEARSTAYATDVAKMIEAPIFHVNGDDPEAVVFICELALRFRQTFAKDVVVDLICYRRHGHNEGDEPAFTQPVLYRTIKEHPSVRAIYTRQLSASGDLSLEEGSALAANFKSKLQQAFEMVQQKLPETNHSSSPYQRLWQGFNQPYSHQPIDTGVPFSQILEVAQTLYTIPEGFALHPKIARQLPERLQSIREQKTVDWATAEALAFGSLLQEGIPVRLSGQDSARGTFSQRHAIWQDLNTQTPYIPANHIAPGQAKFCVYNSMLSEAAVLGFEYGYSLDEPHLLILWEAQFGDFANGAQVIIDQFIVDSTAKWQRSSGLVLLLPHGYEGQGPDHSNAYLERYLHACAEDNIQVCYPTTPAQYFHLLRRQVKRPFRKPLVIMSPKSLLRHPRAISPIAALVEEHFQEIIDDPTPPSAVKRLVLCSGKIYYDLLEAREKNNVDDLALIRIEQFYPFNEQRMTQVVRHYSTIKEVIWTQEEPQNRGGWTFMYPRLQAFFPGMPIHYIGRPASASPATGSLRVHKKEQEGIIQQVMTF